MSSTIMFCLPGMVAMLWIGFVSAISFMEAWLKFRAPGITLKLGLEIGNLVFRALNKVEIALACALAVLWSFSAAPFPIVILLPISIVLLQSVWLLPALTRRLKLRLAGEEVPRTPLHLVYILAEVIKVSGLLVFALSTARD